MDVPSAIKPTPCTKQGRALTPSLRPRPRPGVEHARVQLTDRTDRGACAPYPGSAGGDGLAGLEVVQVGDGLVEGADLDYLEPGRDRALDVGAVRGRGQEDRRARVAGPD